MLTQHPIACACIALGMFVIALLALVEAIADRLRLRRMAEDERRRAGKEKL